MFVLNSSLKLAADVRRHIEDVKKKDRALADQMRRAMQSVVLNTGEARHARGKRAADRFSIAYGELKELEAALQLAVLWSYTEVSADLFDRVDHIGAMLFKASR